MKKTIYTCIDCVESSEHIDLIDGQKKLECGVGPGFKPVGYEDSCKFFTHRDYKKRPVLTEKKLLKLAERIRTT